MIKKGDIVKFKKNKEPCIQYKVLSDVIMEYDDLTLHKYCPMVELEILGLVPTEYLALTKSNENISVVDVAVMLEIDNNEE